jgi:hypothetical protein
MDKLYPDNAHQDHYTKDRGWEFLGSYLKADLYVNHKHGGYLSVVTSNEDSDYAAPCYQQVKSGYYNNRDGYEYYQKLYELAFA